MIKYSSTCQTRNQNYRPRIERIEYIWPIFAIENSQNINCLLPFRPSLHSAIFKPNLCWIFFLLNSSIDQQNLVFEQSSIACHIDFFHIFFTFFIMDHYKFASSFLYCGCIRFFIFHLIFVRHKCQILFSYLWRFFIFILYGNVEEFRQSFHGKEENIPSNKKKQEQKSYVNVHTHI